MRRRLGLVVLTALGALITALPATAATTLPFSAQFPHDTPCGENINCGDGTLQGFGHVTSFVTFDVIDDPGTGCLIIPAERVITLDSDGSTLLLDVNAIACPAGRVLKVPGTFTIVGGTGVFADATGGGELFGTVAPKKAPVHYRGTITLP